jgi:hypothetical protein
LSVKTLESLPVFMDHELRLPMFWSQNSASVAVDVGGIFRRKPTYARISVKIDAVWPAWIQWEENIWFTLKVNGREKFTLPLKPTDWKEYDALDVITVGRNIFEAVIWSTVLVPYERGCKFTIYLDTDAPTEQHYPTQPPQIWWYALAGLVGLTFIAVLVKR